MSKSNINLESSYQGPVNGTVEFTGNNNVHGASNAHNYFIGGKVFGEVTENGKISFAEDNKVTWVLAIDFGLLKITILNFSF